MHILDRSQLLNEFVAFCTQREAFARPSAAELLEVLCNSFSLLALSVEKHLTACNSSSGAASIPKADYR